MKYISIVLFINVLTHLSFVHASNNNLALCLDGQDNNVRTGIGILKGSWTLEAWIKGNDDQWKDQEVIFGGGEYSDINRADNLPLVIEKGKLHSTWAGWWSEEELDDQWHHVALSCDGVITQLFLDGEVVDSKVIATSILPGALGINEEEQPTVFCGLIDEVRIWHSAVPAETLKEWMSKPLAPAHPQFNTLVAYYNFDDGVEIKETVTNWVGRGDQAYHLRNGRILYDGSLPLAHTVMSNNPKFFYTSDKPQELFNAVVIDSEWNVDQGSTDDQILKLRIAVTGDQHPLHLTELDLDLSEITSIDDISRIHVYYTGKTARSGIKTELFGQGDKPQKRMSFKDESGAMMLTPGINYFLVTADISEEAGIGNKIKVSVPSFKLGKKQYFPEKSEELIEKRVTANSRNNSNIIKVLQWNIWHGGRQLGQNGVERIIDLMKATNADIITVQEGYGSQKRIQDSLGYYMQTPSLRDNLVLFSRYPITGIPTKATIFSNPAKLTLPGNRQLLVNSCWLRYADNPNYTGSFPSIGHNTSAWVAEDAKLGLVDVRNIVENDIKPNMAEEEMPVIIEGDFNSCSHLDWTKAAAPLHYGYGPVPLPLPISQYMLEEGYKDSFREINPDEVARPEGTFAVIYGHLQRNRIDFLYYKGKSIRAVSSRIVKTTPEIDDVWASDHAAVLTIFELLPVLP